MFLNAVWVNYYVRKICHIEGTNMVSLQCVFLGGMLDRHLLKYIFHNDYIHMVSRLCVLKCALRCLSCGYNLPHLYVFLPQCVCLCAIRLWFNEKPCHNNHIGIDFLLYAFPSDFWGHYHLSFFSVCNHMWLINHYLRKPCHTGCMNMISSLCLSSCD